jgi:hypothetical protein
MLNIDMRKLIKQKAHLCNVQNAKKQQLLAQRQLNFYNDDLHAAEGE